MFVNVLGRSDMPITDEEQNYYIEHAQTRYGASLEGLEIVLDGDDVCLKYHLKPAPFERVRRITGYLVGTLDRWNNAKRAEEHDRVKHGV